MGSHIKPVGWTLALGAHQAQQEFFLAKMPSINPILRIQGLCSLIYIPTAVLWIPEEVGLCSRFDCSPIWGNQVSSGFVAISERVCSSFWCY